jgi:hypothetical protein
MPRITDDSQWGTSETPTVDPQVILEAGQAQVEALPNYVDPQTEAQRKFQEENPVQPYQGPTPGATEIDNPIGQAMEDLTVNLKSSLTGKTKEEIALERTDQRTQGALLGEALAKVGSAERTKAIEDLELPGVIEGPAKALLGGGEIIVGAGAKTAEGIANTATFAVDLKKTLEDGGKNLVINSLSDNAFPSLFGPLNPKRNVFSNEYDRAQVDLGSSQLAQTGVGKFSKDMLAFGATLYLTGGLKGESGIRGAITAVKGGSGVKGAAQAFGASGAVRGFLADFMQNPEEGNLSNGIRDAMPEWYPDWLTFLAVEEDDSPFLGRLKNGMEGMPLSEAADGLMALAGGWLKARRAAKAGKSTEEALDEGVEEIYRLGVKVRPQPTDWASTAKRFNNLPYFQSGPRNVQSLDPNLIPWNKLESGEIGGFTRNPMTGEEAVSGYMVNVDGAKDLFDFSPASLTRWLTDNAEALSREDTFIGGYIDEMGRPVMEISRQVMDQAEAIRLGVEFDQETIYDVAAGMLSRGEGAQGQLDLGFGDIQGELLTPNTKPVLPVSGKPVTPDASDISLPPSKAEMDAAEKYYKLQGDRVKPWEELTTEDQAGIVKMLQDNKYTAAAPNAGAPQPYIRTAGVSNVGKTRNAGFKDLNARPVDATPQVTARGKAEIGTRSATKTVPQPVNAKDIADSAVAQSKGTPFTRTPAAKSIITKPSMKIIGASPEGQKLLKKFTKQDPDLQAIAAKVGKTPDELRAEAAEAMAQFNGDPTSLGMQVVDGVEVFTAPGTIAAKTIIGDISTRLASTVFKVRQFGDAGMDSLPAVMDMVDEMKALLGVYKYTSQTFGRALNNFKIPGLGIEVPNVFNKSADQVPTVVKEANEILDKLVKDISSGDPKAIREAQIIAGRLQLAGGDPAMMRAISTTMWGANGKSALQMFYNSILSGVKTLTVNLTGNAFNTFYRPAQAWAGSFFMKDGGKMTRQAAAATYAAFGHNMMEAWKVAGIVWQNGGNAINDGSKGLLRASEAESAIKSMRMIADESGDKSMQFGVGVTENFYNLVNNPFLDWPSRFMTTTDEFFKTFVARNENITRSYMEAAEKSVDMPADQMRETFESLIKSNAEKNFDAKSGAILDPELLRAGKETTYQTELEGMAATFARLVEGIPVLRIFFPFIKTGHNIMTYTAQHVPLIAKFTKEYDAAIKSGDPLRIAQMKGRQATGTFIISSAGLMAVSGNLTGNGPSDPNARRDWEENNEPRSIRIPGTKIWIDYSRIEPFNMILGAVADVHYGVTTGELTENMAMHLMGHMVYSVAANFTQKSYYQGLIPFAQILNGNEQSGKKLLNIGAETLNNVLPYAGLRRNLTNLINPYYMEFENELERLKFMGSGGAIGTAAPRYDFIKNDGKPTYSPSGGGNSVWPYKIGIRGEDPVRDEIEDIGLEISDVVRQSDVKLSPTMISAIQKRMGDGRLYKELKQWQGTTAYTNSKDAAKTDRVENNLDYVRVKGRKGYTFYSRSMEIVNAARKEAVDWLYLNDDTYREEAEAINKAEVLASRTGEQPLNTNTNKQLDYLLDLAN